MPTLPTLSPLSGPSLTTGLAGSFSVPDVPPRPVDVGPVVVSRLPAEHERQLALTIDDGIDPAVVGAYLDMVERTGDQLTFFPNGVYPAWTQYRSRLRPLVAAGQVQIGNHTWSHLDLTRPPDARVLAELRRNHVFLVQTLGVDPRPWWRPP